jgi:NitT/TauT family transport system substrate-binding protein
MQPKRDRRAIWVALAAVCVLVFGACTGSTPSSAPPSASSAPTTAPATSASSPSASATASSGTVQLPTPEVSNVVLGLLQATTGHDAEIAIEQGLFQKYGLNITYHTFSSQGSEVQALQAGQIDIALNIGVAEDIASTLTDSPMVVVEEEKGNLSDNLYSSKNITTGNELIGKSIAVSSFGSVTYGEALIALKVLGLTQQQVTITQVGNDGARRAALAAGSVGASLNDESEKTDMLAAGFHELVPLHDLPNYGLPVGDTITTVAYEQKNPNTVLAVVAALIEGTHIFLTDPNVAIQAAMKFESVDQKTATANVQYDLAGWQPTNGIPRLSDFQAAQALYAKTDPSIATVDLSKTYTTQFTDKLQSLGWYQAMGISTTK